MPFVEALWEGEGSDGGEFAAGLDFDHTIGRRLASTEGRATDFDGEAGFGDDRGEFGGVEAREVGELPKMVMVVT